MTVCKRIGAWLLTLVLLVSALPYTAFAASEDSHVVNATMEETSVEDIANNVTTQLLRGAKTKDETLSMEAKPTHEDSDSVEIIVVVDDSVAKPTAQAQVQSLLQKQEKAAATMSRAIGETVEPQRQAPATTSATALPRHLTSRSLARTTSPTIPTRPAGASAPG